MILNQCPLVQEFSNSIDYGYGGKIPYLPLYRTMNKVGSKVPPLNSLNLVKKATLKARGNSRVVDAYVLDRFH
tara:strand:- start:394 stop:612 length:219 start_codon:yes stop_codon:yes gene_type:complete